MEAFQGDILPHLKWVKQTNRPWWPGVVFDSWKSLRQSLCPKYAEYKRWSIQVHVSSRKFQFDPVGKPGQKAVIFFTGEGKMPHFEVLEDANNKRTVDYVDGFDEHYTDGRSQMNAAARAKLEGAVAFADGLITSIAHDEPSELFSPDTTYSGGSPMTAKSTASRSSFGSSFAANANNVSASTTMSTSSSKKNLSASFEVGNSLKSPTAIKSVLKSGNILKSGNKKKKGFSSSSDSNDRRSSWASPVSNVGAANVSIGSSISSAPSSSGWSKPENFKERKAKLKRLATDHGFKRIFSRLIENGWNSDMKNSVLYYFLPGYSMRVKGIQGKDFFTGDDKEALIEVVAKSKRWHRVVTAKDEGENEVEDVKEVSMTSSDANTTLESLSSLNSSTISDQQQEEEEEEEELVEDVPEESPTTRTKNFKSPARKKSRAPPPTPSSVSSTSSMISEYMLSSREAWRLLQKLDCKYSGGVYRPPNSNSKDKTSLKFGTIERLVLWVYETELLEKPSTKEILGEVDHAQLDEYVTAEAKEMEKPEAQSRALYAFALAPGGKRERVKRRIGTGTSPQSQAAAEAAKTHEQQVIMKQSKEYQEKMKKQKEAKLAQEAKKKQQMQAQEAEEELKRLEKRLQNKITDQTIFAGIWPDLKAKGWAWGKGPSGNPHVFVPANRKGWDKGKGTEGKDWFRDEAAVLDSLKRRGRTAEEQIIENLQKEAGGGRRRGGMTFPPDFDIEHFKRVLDGSASAKTITTTAKSSVSTASASTSRSTKNASAKRVGKDKGKKKKEKEKQRSRRDSSPKTPPDVKKTKPQSPGGCLSDSSADPDEPTTEEIKKMEYDWKELWPRLQQAGWVSKKAPKKYALQLTYVYLRPKRDLQNGSMNVDFFGSKDDVVEFVKAQDRKLRRTSKSSKKPINMSSIMNDFSQEAAAAEEDSSDGMDDVAGDCDDNFDAMEVESHRGSDDAGMDTSVIKTPKVKLDTKLSSVSTTAAVETPTTSASKQEASSPLESALIQMKTIKGTPVQKNDDWLNVWEKMKYTGWEWQDGVAPFYNEVFLLPGGKRPNEGGVKGIDYLTSFTECKVFAYKNFGWKGDKQVEAALEDEKLEKEGGGGRGRRRRRNTPPQLPRGREREAAKGRGVKRPAAKTKNIKKRESPRKKTRTNGRRGGVAVESDDEVSVGDESDTDEEGGEVEDMEESEEEEDNGESEDDIEEEEEEEERPRGATSTTTSSTTTTTTTTTTTSLTSTKSVSQPTSQPQNVAVEPLTSGTIREVLEVARQNLHPSTLASPNTQRSEEYLHVLEFMKDAMKKWGGAGTLYCCGGPGTGKTITVTHAVSAAKAWGKENEFDLVGEKNSRFSGLPSVAFVNVAHLQNDGGGVSPEQKILDEIGRGLGLDDGVAKSAVAKKLEKNGGGNKRMTFLVLDEMDLLVKQKGGAGEKFLYTLFKWSSDERKMFTLICISNSIDFRSTLKKLGEGDEGDAPEVKVFAPYPRGGLADIMQARAGIGVFQKPALELISRKTAATSGDCRRALELASKSIGVCLDLMASEKGALELDFDKDRPPVQIKHVMKAVKSSLGNNTKTIEGLPVVQQVVLCVAVVLGGEGAKTAGSELTVGKLMMYAKEAARHGLLDRIDPSIFMDVLSSLQDLGLIDIGVNEGGSGGGADQRRRIVRLKTNLDEVEIALEEALGDKPFFRDLMKRVSNKVGTGGGN
ncbi:hypothetical protein TrCOL_g7236 [Triparma columacea]|nr:hypothetical protein TrCOL_g7236 [Triparma columacea]